MKTMLTTQSVIKRVAALLVALLVPLMLITIVSGCGSPQASSDVDVSVGLGEPLVEERIESRVDPIPASSRSELDETLPVGQTRVERAGVDGLKKVTYSIIFTDGVETGRETLSEVIIERPVTEIILVGGFSASSSSSSSSQQSGSGATQASGTVPAATASAPQGFTPPPAPEPECDSNEWPDCP